MRPSPTDATNTIGTTFTPGLASLGQLIRDIGNLFTWYKSNSPIRYIAQGPITQRHPLLIATGPTLVEFASFYMTVKANTQSRGVFIPTLVALAIVIFRPSEPPGQLDLSTLEEAITPNQVPLYTLPNNVIAGAMFFYQTPQGKDVFNGGFKRGAYPGPIALGAGDRIDLVCISSDNYDNWRAGSNNSKGFITGSFTYQLGSQGENVNPVNA